MDWLAKLLYGSKDNPRRSSIEFSLLYEYIFVNNRVFIDSSNPEQVNDVTYIKHHEQLPCFCSLVFVSFWIALFCGLVLPNFHYVPKGLTIMNHQGNDTDFVAERAMNILKELEIIGPKVVGSYANENLTVQLLLNKLINIKESLHKDLFNMEIDQQIVSGAYIHWQMVNMYQGVQNVVVKFSSKNSTSESALLINSHFDSKPGSPGSGDDGVMVVTMLEALRVLSTTRETLRHTIIFLFNGAEENPLQASHGFITQHKWAKYCKAVINLDCAGSGNREILFQTGPNHPWLIKYYSQHVKRPFATTMAEEIFQANLLPSDTDFRIFRDFGKIPGLDLAHTYNGYVYHTAFDRTNVISLGSIQNTGNNLISLIRALGNAYELDNPSLYAKGHTIFYDFLGFFLINYSATDGLKINFCTSVLTIILVGISIWRMAAVVSISMSSAVSYFTFVVFLQITAFISANILTILTAATLDLINHSMSWFSNKWLVIGLYICPTLFGLILPTLLHIHYKYSVSTFKNNIIDTITVNKNNFYNFHDVYVLIIIAYFWAITVLIGQIMPFLYFSYVTVIFLFTLIPMMGRYGTALNPDIVIGSLCCFGTLLAGGFLIHLFHFFRRTKLLVTFILIVYFVFLIIATTPVGFPYRSKTNVDRVNFLHVYRIFYDYAGNISLNDSGYYFDFQDRNAERPMKSFIDLNSMKSIDEDCKRYMMCGLPLFNHRMYAARKYGKWFPTYNSTQILPLPSLRLIEKYNITDLTLRYEFELEGPSHMSIFIQPFDYASISNWSFLKEKLLRWQPPYHIYFSYGIDRSPLKFYLNLTVSVILLTDNILNLFHDLLVVKLE
ncbi:endoplasmic reticulum metallopeptidase 1-like [Teleopsis dalmanni]|uniref:endoplasmic reticulum metallopeptidase 1-like n=1 Tax=Teleopsis dalmanni TaxID=139649 RepID=UPI0018CD91FA|nr:endoplasmic reticulum metallopeptidase 1-like [Teleopsis dalmanni]